MDTEVSRAEAMEAVPVAMVAVPVAMAAADMALLPTTEEVIRNRIINQA